MILLHSCSPCQCSRRAVRWSQGSSALSHQGSPPLPSYPSAPSSHTLLLNIQTIHWLRPPLILCIHLSHSASTVTRNWQELLGSFLFWLQYSIANTSWLHQICSWPHRNSSRDIGAQYLLRKSSGFTSDLDGARPEFTALFPAAPSCQLPAPGVPPRPHHPPNPPLDPPPPNSGWRSQSRIGRVATPVLVTTGVYNSAATLHRLPSPRHKFSCTFWEIFLFEKHHQGKNL